MTAPQGHPAPLRIGNASGFYGDRFDAMREMLTGGQLDVLTGDYLAELTMLILGRDRLKNPSDPSAGYARTFLRQLEECLGLAHERGVRIVANAGGLNPAGLAENVRKLADRLGIPARVAHVEGDDLTAGHPNSLAAHAYLGAFGIAACLREGADVVVTGRVTDAALVAGPAAAHFGWGPADHDRLAGAVVAGHVLECGTQATGGNYAFFAEHIRQDRGILRHPGFPLAEIHSDGTSVITKHPDTGGVVDIGTVTAQLLYETQGARYAGPDVTARLDTVRLTQDGPDRVRIHGVRGEAPPPTLKLGLNRLGGFRNEVTFVLTGLDIEHKAALVRDQLETALHAAKSRPAEVSWTLARTDHPDAPTEETASALLRLVVRDPDQNTVGRTLSGAAVELALASYPGFHVLAPPERAPPTGSSRRSTSRRTPWTTWQSWTTDAGSPYRRRTTPSYSTSSRNRPCPSPCHPARPAAPPWASSPVPAAVTRAATPTSVSGCALARPGAGSRTPSPSPDSANCSRRQPT